jgi:FkbH-like protein
MAEGDPAGEAYRSVQKAALELRRRGVLLAVCSKNDDHVARLPFREHPEMILREKDISVFQANWQDKPSNIRAIARELSLGLESMVFLDDNPAERALVREILPEVAVPELPEDPAFYARTLAAGGYFEAISFSSEDVHRAQFYADNARRGELIVQTGDMESYLRSLDMELSLRPFDKTGRARIVQLISKSNQYNLTTKRYTEVQVAQMEKEEKYFTLQVRLSDVFGDNGMISVVICAEDVPREWRVDTWLMSCRVLGRRVETAILNNILHHARERGIRKLVGTYIPTERNRLVEDHYSKLGFQKIEEREDRSAVYELEVTDACVEVPMKVFCEYCESACA